VPSCKLWIRASADAAALLNMHCSLHVFCFSQQALRVSPAQLEASSYFNGGILTELSRWNPWITWKERKKESKKSTQIPYDWCRHDGRMFEECSLTVTQAPEAISKCIRISSGIAGGCEWGKAGKFLFIKMKLGVRYKIEGGTSPSPEGPSVGMELLGTHQQKQQAAPTN